MRHVDESSDWDVDHLTDVHHPGHPHSRHHVYRDFEVLVAQGPMIAGHPEPGYVHAPVVHASPAQYIPVPVSVS